jgi:hypothetical protein
VWSLLWTGFSVSIPTGLSVETAPALVALYVQASPLATVCDGYTMFLVYVSNELNQNPFGFLPDVFALEVTV